MTLDNSVLMPITGGLLIGIAAVGLMAFSGRIAGVSGILWSAVCAERPFLWRWLFVLGMPGGAFIGHSLLGAPLPAPSQLPTAVAISAGFLVGFGVKLGSGCTSGHGVCGIGLLSERSIVATLSFMAAGIATVWVVRHGLGAAA